MNDYIMLNGELYHYGVKGMKWGVRRYQNSDGSLTAAGKKRLAKSIKKQYPKNSTNAAWKQARNDIADDLADNYNAQLRVHMSNIREKRKFFDRADDAQSAFYNSKEYDNIRESSYKETYDWFEKNDPDYLRRIISANNGDKTTLRRFSDFDTMMDGVLDHNIFESRNKFLKKKGFDPKDVDDAFGEYMKACRAAATDVVGMYGNMKLPKQYSWQNDTTVHQLVTAAIRELESDDRFKYL